VLTPQIGEFKLKRSNVLNSFYWNFESTIQHENCYREVKIVSVCRALIAHLPVVFVEKHRGIL